MRTTCRVFECAEAVFGVLAECRSAISLLRPRAATERHSKTTRDALTGKGVDRHLSALEDTGKKAGVPTADIFTDKGMAVGVGSRALIFR